MFPNPHSKHDPDCIIDLLEEKIHYLYNHDTDIKTPTNETFYNAQLTFDFKKNFSMFYSKAFPFQISSFEQLGICDPFSEEKRDCVLHNPMKYTDLAYDAKRYQEGESPKCIYFPSKFLLFNLMRASIDVSDETQLWFNRCV